MADVLAGAKRHGRYRSNTRPAMAAVCVTPNMSPYRNNVVLRSIISAGSTPTLLSFWACSDPKPRVISPIDGRPGFRLTSFSGPAITRNFAWSPDGRRLLLSRGENKTDVVLFKRADSR
jgi:hypothetical protein